MMEQPYRPQKVVVIGPQQAGKTSIGRLLAQQLGLPFVDAIREAERLLADQGFDPEAAGNAWRQHGLDGALRYHAPFDAYLVERILADMHGVIELGAFQVVPQIEEYAGRVARALEPMQYVVLVRPSPDDEQAIRELEQRGRVCIDGLEINEHFVRHHSNHDLARLRVYTNNKTPDQVADEIAPLLDPSSDTVILIGPVGAGKSTIGRLLAERLGRPQRPLDDLRWEYYNEIGFSRETQQALAEREGFAGVYRYWKPFELHAVKRVLEQHQGAIIDFGAGHSIQEDDARFARLQALLEPFPNVVLLLPSPDLNESVTALAERGKLKVGGIPATRYLVTHPAFRQYATHTVYTDGRTPEQSAAELAALLGAPPA